MGCLQSKTANVQSPDQEPSQPDSKPDLGILHFSLLVLLYQSVLMGFFFGENEVEPSRTGSNLRESVRIFNGPRGFSEEILGVKEEARTKQLDEGGRPNWCAIIAKRGFNSDLIVSESGEKAPNVVYRGKLRSNSLVAIKRFSKQSWPDPQQFVAEAAGVGKVRHKRLVNLIGCCAEGDERLLVLPNDTLSKHLFHCTALDLIRGNNVLLLMDSSLEGQYANEDATALVELASKCLQYEARDRPDVASHVLMVLTKTPVVIPTMLSPLGKACSKMDLTAVHDILLKTGYKDEEGAENELSFQEWTQNVQDMLNTKRFGYIAFRDKDFKSAIDYYSKHLPDPFSSGFQGSYRNMDPSSSTSDHMILIMPNTALGGACERDILRDVPSVDIDIRIALLVSMMSVPSGTVFAGRALSYLMISQPELALRDAMQAQVCLPEWPTAFYLQALALSKLGMETDAQDMLNDGASFEAKKLNSWRN
ncbi:hypothetical protein DH2020_023405 [Rehmannia glutinosa]|uniref:Serine/threonine-protein kinase BSK1-like TPR repeats domain-containing protein n=1 Tax=Rehmannia glutinosa TaxID=99300 RepID=A0ABR0W601_REHGL